MPAGTTYTRFSLFDANVTAGEDLDLEVYDAAFTFRLAAAAAARQPRKSISLNLAPGTYYVLVVGYAAPGRRRFTLFFVAVRLDRRWQHDGDCAGNAVTGTSGSIGLTFRGLMPGTKYLGSVAYGGTTGMPNPTIVRVDP